MTRSISYFETLFRSHFKSLCDIANKIINDQDAAQDIVQDVFLKLWKKEEEQLFAITNMKGYLFKATTNEAINYLERNKKKISLYKIKFTPAVNPVENFTANELEENIKSS
ncbi:MAG: RNA polymerase sigma factor, partial [Bacteroidia bacterium]